MGEDTFGRIRCTSEKMERDCSIHSLMFQGVKRSFIPLDIDISPFDNSFTKKEGVSRTYKGHDGYSPIFAYLGLEGYAVNTQLRYGYYRHKGWENLFAGIDNYRE